MTPSDFQNRKDKLLFTPGPLTTKASVKEAALYDLGSRDSAFITVVQQIRKKLLDLAHVESPDYETVIIQGSGTFGIESVISSAIPSDGVLLNVINGAYGRRISEMARIHSVKLFELHYDENQLPDLEHIESVLKDNSEISHISVIHGETTTGLINPVAGLGDLAARYGKVFIVDAMSTFGAYEMDLKKLKINYLISSSNKCIEGIPGFSFVIARRSDIESCKDQARTLSLDLFSQWAGLNSNGQFRFTPPVQSLLAFHKALEELEKEGGIRGRAKRYANNNSILMSGMIKLGFKPYLTDSIRGYIITSFLYPDHPAFSFETFYSKLNEKGFVIYPGKLSKTDCFRIGNIGQLYDIDIKLLIEAIEEVFYELEIDLKNN
jgi:2-aminoethylphosphonate-pyruvate transaminase